VQHNKMKCKYCQEEISTLKLFQIGIVSSEFLYFEGETKGAYNECNFVSAPPLTQFNCPECGKTIAHSEDEALACFRSAHKQSPIPAQQLKGGGCKMEQQIEQTATMCPTKTGNGFKVVVNGVWYYASKKAVLDVVNKGARCVFKTITDAPVRTPVEDEY